MPNKAGPAAPTVVVFGSANWDHVVSVERLPSPGETLIAEGYFSVPGGKGLNQAVTAARQGAEVTMVCCVGADEPGRALTDVFEAEAVSTIFVRPLAGRSSGAALITVAKGGANTIVVAPGANAALSREQVEAAGEHLRPGAVALAQMEVPLEPVAAALFLAKKNGAKTVLNPAPARSHLPAQLLANVDVLVPNEGEAISLSGRGSADEAAEALCRSGCKAVVITLGDRGALVAEAGRPVVHVPSFEVEAIDTTAAGDAFCGALSAALAEGAELVEAVRRGCAAGALAATVLGALPSLPARDKVLALLSASVSG